MSPASTRVGTHAASFDAHLAAADDAVDMRFGTPYAGGVSRVIRAAGMESASTSTRGDGKPAEAVGGLASNVFHLRVVMSGG